MHYFRLLNDFKEMATVSIISVNFESSHTSSAPVNVLILVKM